jgi:hypothetical protein
MHLQHTSSTNKHMPITHTYTLATGSCGSALHPLGEPGLRAVLCRRARALPPRFGQGVDRGRLAIGERGSFVDETGRDMTRPDETCVSSVRRLCLVYVFVDDTGRDMTRPDDRWVSSVPRLSCPPSMHITMYKPMLSLSMSKYLLLKCGSSF